MYTNQLRKFYVGPKEVKANNVDTYMIPLMKDLKKLWELGFQIDIKGERIMVQVMLIHFMHDYPGELLNLYIYLEHLEKQFL